MNIALLCGRTDLTIRVCVRSLGTILGRCYAHKISRPMGRLPLIVSHVLISLKECSTLYSILTHTHTHTNIHLTINMASNIPKPNIHQSCLSTKPSIHLSWHLIQGNNKSWQQVCMVETQTWQNPNKHVIALRTNHPRKHVHTHHQTYT